MTQKFYNPTILVKDTTQINPAENKIILIPYGEIIHGINIKNWKKWVINSNETKRI